MRRRLVLLVAAAAALLSGCTVTGHVAIEQQEVVFDLRVEHDVLTPQGRAVEAFRPCLDAGTRIGLKVARAEAPEGRRACFITGSLSTEDGSGRSLVPYLLATDQVVTLSIPPAFAETLGEETPLEAIDVTVSFPGEVLIHTGTGTLSGQQVRWNDVEAVHRDGIIAASRPAGSPPWTLLSYLGTAAAGLALGGGAVWWWGRRRDAGVPAEPPSDPAPPTDVDAPRVAPPEPAEPQPEDPTVWAPGQADN